jgi:hypothetical protein
LLVKTQLKKCPESSQRKIRWLPVPEAAAVIDDDDLRQLILQTGDLGEIQAGAAKFIPYG